MIFPAHSQDLLGLKQERRVATSMVNRVHLDLGLCESARRAILPGFLVSALFLAETSVVGDHAGRHPHGVVAAGHPLATRAGLNALHAG